MGSVETGGRGSLVGCFVPLSAGNPAGHSALLGVCDGGGVLLSF